jgi:hypothetical protein
MMSKEVDEIACDIMVAWLNAIGSAPCGEDTNAAHKALDLLSDEDKITGFYKKICKTVVETYKPSDD